MKPPRPLPGPSPACTRNPCTASLKAWNVGKLTHRRNAVVAGQLVEIALRVHPKPAGVTASGCQVAAGPSGRRWTYLVHPHPLLLALAIPLDRCPATHHRWPLVALTSLLTHRLSFATAGYICTMTTAGFCGRLSSLRSRRS